MIRLYDHSSGQAGRAIAGTPKGKSRERPSIPVVQPMAAHNASPVQKITRTGYLSSDSWQNWKGEYKPGAKEKWEHLISLYTECANVINKDNTYPEEVVNTLSAIYEKTIGLSEYGSVLEELNQVHRIMDKKNLEYSRKYRSDLMEELEKHLGEDSRFSQSKQVTIKGDKTFVDFTKALLFKITTSSFGNDISNAVLDIIEDSSTQHPIILEPGAECLAIFQSTETTISLFPKLDDYASGQNGEIIPSTIEIALVHELGHVWNSLKGKRGLPKKTYGSLDAESKSKWSDEEEYVNITQVENKFRHAIQAPLRKYHSGDPLIHTATLDLSFIFKNEAELNLSILKQADEGETDLLLSPDEINDFENMKGLMKREDLDDEEILDCVT